MYELNQARNALRTALPASERSAFDERLQSFRNRNGCDYAAPEIRPLKELRSLWEVLVEHYSGYSDLVAIWNDRETAVQRVGRARCAK